MPCQWFHHCMVRYISTISIGLLLLTGCGNLPSFGQPTPIAANDPTATSGAATPYTEATSTPDLTSLPDNTEATPTPDLTSLSGNIVIDGSSTVFPVTRAVAEEFAQIAPQVRVSVGISGSGGGFKKFCNAETDISNASRPIRPEEIEVCESRGVKFIEIPVAYDGISVIVHPQNTFATCLTVEELRRIWEPAAQGTITRWNQIRPDFPDEPLTLFAPGTDSGTFDYFTEAIVGKAKESRGDYQATEDDDVIVFGVANSPYALGYLGYAYVVVNIDKVQPVEIDNGNGCVAPSFASIGDASYQPLSRPLFIYVNAAALERPELEAFVRFYLSEEMTSLIETPEVGYVALTDELYAAGLQRLENRELGTLFLTGEEVGVTLDRFLR